MALLDNLISYWKLDEASGNAADSHGSNTGTASNITYGATGIINDAFDHNAVGDCDLGQPGDFRDVAAFSIQAWFKTADGTSTINSLFSNMAGGSSADSYNFYCQNKKLQFFCEATSSVNTAGGTDIDNDAFHHGVAVYNGTDMRVYVDGSLDNTAAGNTGTVGDNSHDVKIGEAVANSTFFNGELDEVAFWDRALTATEVTELYNSGAGLAYDFSGTPLENASFLGANF